MKKNALLGVNIDHIATIRNFRNTLYPDPIQAAFIAEEAGANSITVHLREDRRHINERDIYLLRKTITTKMNLEMAMTDEMIKIACDVQPDFCCLVPEKRQEITTEKGLDVINNIEKISKTVKILQSHNICVSLFIDPDKYQIDASILSGVSFIEIHTGSYCKQLLKNSYNTLNKELLKIHSLIKYAHNKGLNVNAGHGLNYHNVVYIASLPEVHELNIGHAIISRSLFTGLFTAIKEIKEIIINSRYHN